MPLPDPVSRMNIGSYLHTSFSHLKVCCAIYCQFVCRFARCCLSWLCWQLKYTLSLVEAVHTTSLGLLALYRGFCFPSLQIDVHILYCCLNVVWPAPWGNGRGHVVLRYYCSWAKSLCSLFVCGPLLRPLKLFTAAGTTLGSVLFMFLIWLIKAKVSIAVWLFCFLYFPLCITLLYDIYIILVYLSIYLLTQKQFKRY